MKSKLEEIFPELLDEWYLSEESLLNECNDENGDEKLEARKIEYLKRFDEELENYNRA